MTGGVGACLRTVHPTTCAPLRREDDAAGLSVPLPLHLLTPELAHPTACAADGVLLTSLAYLPDPSG